MFSFESKLLTLYSSLLTICRPGLTLTNHTFCPHSAFTRSVWISEQTAIMYPYSIKWMIFITEIECVYCAVRTGSLYIYNSTFCPHIAFTYYVRISEQTSIISLYSINWMVFITETECVYCAVRTGSLYIILRSAHTVYLCVLCESENKQRLFTCTALTDWFV